MEDGVLLGLELELKDSRWRIVRDNRGMPKWIRPVLRYSASGEIPNVIAIGISTLDVVCIEGVEACPVGAQHRWKMCILAICM